MERPKGIRVMAVLHMILTASALYRIVTDLGAMKDVRRLGMLTEVNPGSLTNAYRAYASGASTYWHRPRRWRATFWRDGTFGEMRASDSMACGCQRIRLNRACGREKHRLF